MPQFNPKQRTQMYAEISAQVLANAPLTSTELGEVSDNLIFGCSDQIYELYVEMENGISLLNLDSTTGTDLDAVVSEYPDMPPRFAASRATTVVTVGDPDITKIADEVDSGGSQQGDNFLNLDDASEMPTSGSVLVGVRGGTVFETFNYDGKTSNQLTSTIDTIDFDHGSGEPVVLTTVGDRVFPGPFQAATEPTANTATKTYSSTSSLTIYDGEETGSMSVRADQLGLIGNTPGGTINKFIGTPPFPGATVINEVRVSNGMAREKDPDLRARIRQQKQALSSANIDAVVAALFTANFEGQRVLFAQVVEDPDPNIPSYAYVDDGSGFVASTRTYTAGITLVDSALGSEKKFEIPSEFRPMTTLDAEDLTRVYASITLHKNGSPLTQGDGASEYRLNPYRGIIRLNTGLQPGDTLTIPSITHFTGLVQEANWRIYGKREDRANYKGIVGLGEWIRVLTPATQFVTVQGNVTLDGSRPINDVVNEIRQNIIDYIQTLGIAGTVVKNKLISLGFVPGVKDFQLILPVGDVIVPDGTLARSGLGNVTIS